MLLLFMNRDKLQRDKEKDDAPHRGKLTAKLVLSREFVLSCHHSELGFYLKNVFSTLTHSVFVSLAHFSPSYFRLGL